MRSRALLFLPLLLAAHLASAGPIQIGFGGGASVPVSDTKDAFKSGWHGSGIVRLNVMTSSRR